MDIKLLNKITESFILDFGLMKTQLWKTHTSCLQELFTIGQEHMHAFQNDYPEAYVIFDNMSYTKKYDTLYFIFEEVLKDTYIFDELSYNPFDELYEDDDITDSLTVIGAYALGGVLTAYISRVILKIFPSIGNRFVKVLTSIDNLVMNIPNLKIFKNIKSVRVYASLIHNSNENCQARCNPDPAITTRLSSRGLTYLVNRETRSRLSPKEIKQLNCLVECYMENFLKMVQYSGFLYMKCMSNSDNRAQLSEFKNIDSILFQKFDKDSCKDIHSHAQSLFKQWEELYDIIKKDKHILKKYDFNIFNVFFMKGIRGQEPKLR